MKGMVETAQVLHRRGRLSEAEVHYREILRWEPDAVEALGALGVLAYQTGRIGEARDLFARGSHYDRMPPTCTADSRRHCAP